MALTEIHTPSPQGRPAAKGSQDAKRTFRPEPCDAALTLTVVEDRTSESWDRAERFVYEVFRASNFCEPSRRHWVEETEPYRPGSRFHVVSDGEELVGVIRTFVGTYEELPIGQFPARIDVPTTTMIEIGSLAVSPTMRGLGVANELHRSAVQDAIRAGVPAFCMLVEPWSIDFFRDVYGLPLVQTAPAQDYMGSLTVPAIADMATTLHTLVSEMPALYEWLVEGLEPELWSRGDLPIVLH